MPTPDWNDRLKFAVQAARDAGRLTLEYYRRADLAVITKADDSPVTIADREAEQQLRKQAAEAFPHDAFLGEEFGETPGDSGFRWIVDPIDGTKSFVHGVPLYGTMVALEYDGTAVAGVVVIPGQDEYIYAGQGSGAWFARGEDKPAPARVRNQTDLSQATFLTTCVSTYEDAGSLPAFERMRKATRLCRTWGDCYGYTLVATGRADVMVDPRMNVWDNAALQPIMQEAGGVFTDWSGVSTIFAKQTVATNPQLLETVLKTLHG